MVLAVTVLVTVAVGVEGLKAGSTAAPEASTARVAAEPSPSLLGDGEDRVLFVGDSLTFGAHDELEATLLRHGVETRFVGYPGTGLLSGQGMWLKGITSVVSDWHPDLVVIEACCNYANHERRWRAPDGHLVAPDTPEMYAAWSRAAREAVRRASAGGAAVRWVVTPEVGPGVKPAIRMRVAGFERIASRLGVERVDWRNPLEPSGRFTRFAVVNGRVQAIRKDDDLHITDAGDVLVAAATWEAIGPILAGSTP